MDRKLVGWARVVKARRSGRGFAQGGSALPPLWLFADRTRVPDLIDAVRRLPVGLAGVVMRDGGTGAAARMRRIALLCRRRRLMVSIAAGAGLGARCDAGLHLRGGRRRGGPRPAFLTSSAHDAAEVRRALRAGAAVIFLSPVFATLSHPRASVLGPTGWSALARSLRVGALGGIDGRSVRRLPRRCGYVGAVGALVG